MIKKFRKEEVNSALTSSTRRIFIYEIFFCITNKIDNKLV